MKNIKLQELKRYLKSQLKNKISINSKTIIAFLIMGFMGLSTISFSRWDYIRIEDNKIRPDGNNITNPSEGSILLTDNNSSENMKYGIVIGYGVDNLKTKIEASTTQPVKSVAIGIGAQVLMNPFNFRSNEAGEGHQGVALGSNAVTTDQGVAVGNDVYAVGRSSIAIGSDDNQKYQNKITKHDFDNYFKILYKGIDSTGTVYGYDVNGDTPNGHESNKVFSPTLAKGDGSISIGSRALAFDEGTTALGTFAFALKKGATAIGTLSRAEGQGAIAFGRESKVFSNNTIGAGNEVQVLKDGGAAFGYRAYSGGEGSIALGTEVYANSEIDTTAIKQIVNGTNLNKKVNPFTILKQDLNGIAKSAATNKILKSGEYFGQSGKGYLEEVEKIISQDIITRKTEKFNDVEGVSKTKGNHSIVIGSKAIASNDNSVALGRGSFSLEKNAMALGSYSYSDSENAIAIGVASKGLGKNSIAIGVGTGVGKGEKENNKDYGKNSLAIGTGSYTSGNNSSLIGTDSRVWSDNSGSFGSYNDVSGVNNLALGNGIFILNNKIEEGATKDTNDIIRKKDIVLSNYKLLIPTRNNVALGNAITIASGVRNSLVLGTNSSIGDEKIDNNDITDSMVLGNGASVIADVKKGDNFKGNQAMAIGALAVATLNNSIALGHSSKTDYSVEDLEKEGWMPKGILSVPSSTKVGILSVGSKGAERRIANVAAGYRETDAVNVSQLRAIEEKLSQTGMIDDDSFEDNVHYISINKKGSDLNKIEALKQREIDYKEYIQYKSRQLEIKVREKRGDNINNGYKSKVNKKVTELEAKSANKAIQQSKLKAVTIQTNSSNFDYEAEMNKIYEAKNSDINNKKNLFEDAERTEMNASNFNNEGAIGIDSIAIGAYAKSTGNQAVSIGKNATAGEGSVAIGSSSIAKEDKSVSYLTNVANTDGRTFSVGSDTVKRRLKNLADGSADSDAVTVAQLKRVGNIKFQGDSGSESTFDITKRIEVKGSTAQKANNGGAETWGQGDAKHTVENIQTFTSKNGDTQKILIGMKDKPRFSEIKLGNSSEINLRVSNDGNLAINSKKLTGLASATADSDAVTYGQVKNGFKVEADNASDKNIGLGKILEITGRKIDGTASFDAWSINNLEGKNGRYSSENIETFVSQDTTGKTSVLIGLKENPRFTEIQIGDKDKNLKIKQIEEKFNFSDKGISGVATGQINSTSNDVVVGSQLNDYVKEIASNGDITVSAKQNVTGGGQKYTLSLSESLKNKINSLTDVDTKVKGATEKVVNADDYITVNEENGINGLGKTFKVGLAQKTKTKIDNALDKALSTIDADGKKVIKSLVNVTKDTLTNGDENILNVTTENDNTSNENAKNYKLSVSKAKVKEIVSAEIAGYKVEANTDSPITVANEGKKVKLGLDKAKAVEILSKDADIDTPKVGNSSLVTDSQVHIAVEKAKENVVAKADSSIEVTSTNGSNGKGTTYTVGLKQEVEDKLKNIGNMDAYAKLDGTNLNDQKFDKNIWSNALGTDNITNPTVGNGSLVTEKAVINYVKEQGINFETDNQAKQLVKLGETIDFSSKTGNNKNDIETWDFGTGSDKTHSTANVSTKYETKDNKKHLLIGIKENPTFKNVVADSLVFGSKNTDPKLFKTNEGNLQLNNKKLTGLVDGTIDTDAATVAQVNSAKENVLGTTDYIKVTEGTNGKAKTFTVDLEESVKNKLNNIGEGKVEASNQNTVKGNVVYSAIKDARTKVKLENIQNDKNYLTLTENPENNENSISARTYTLGLNKSELKKDFVEKNADNLDDSNIQAWKTKLGITKGSVEEVEASTDSPIMVNSEATTDGKKFTLTLDKAKAVTVLSKDANIDNPNTNNISLVTDSQVHTAVEKAKENVIGKNNEIEVTSVEETNKGKTFTIGLNQEIKTKLDNIGAGEVVANNANTVNGGKIFTAITNAKTKVDKADNEEVVTVTKTETSDINSNTYKIGVNKEKITELIDVVAKTAEAGKEQMLEVESTVDNTTKKKTFTVSLSDASLNKIDNALDKTTAEKTYAKVALDNINDAGKKVIKDLVNVSKNTIANDENILEIDGGKETDSQAKEYKLAVKKSEVQKIAKDSVEVTSEENSGITVTPDKTTDTKKTTYKLTLDGAKIKELAGTTDLEKTYAKKDASNLDENNATTNRDNWINKLGTENISETITENAAKGKLTTEKAVKDYVAKEIKNVNNSLASSTLKLSNGTTTQDLSIKNDTLELVDGTNTTVILTKDDTKKKATFKVDVKGELKEITSISSGENKAKITLNENDITVNKKIKGLEAGTEDTDAINKKQLDEELAKKANSTDLETYAKKDGSNITEADWVTKLGDESIENGDKLAKSSTVKSYVDKIQTALQSNITQNTNDITGLKSEKANVKLDNINDEGKKVIKNLIKVSKADGDDNIVEISGGTETNGQAKEYKLAVKKSEVQKIAKDSVEVTSEENSGITVTPDKTTDTKKTTYKLTLDGAKIKELAGTTDLEKTYAKKDASNLDENNATTNRDNWINKLGTENISETITENAAKGKLTTEKAVKTYVDGKGLKFSTNKIGDEVNVNLGQTLAIKGEEDEAIVKETTFESAKGNVYIEKNGEQGLVVKLAKKLKNIESIELKKGDKASNITINDSGDVTVNGNEIITTGNISNQTIGYKANNTNVKTVKLSEGFNFTSGTNTEAVVEDNGVVKFNLKDELTNIKSISGLTEKTVDDMYGTTEGEAATRKEVKTVYNKLKDNNKEQAKLKNGTLGTLVYTDKDGNKLMKDTDGKFYKAQADGTKEENAQEVVSENVILSTVKPNGKTTEPITLGNVASALGLSKDNNKEILNKLVNKKAEASMNYTEIELNKVVTLRDLQFLAKQGITFAGSIGTSNKYLGDTITINGSNSKDLTKDNFATKYETKNIAVKVDNNTGNIEVGLAKELKAIESIENKETKVTLTENGTEFKTGTDGVTTKIDKEGIKITKGDKILSIKATEKGGSITGIEEKIVDENYGTTEGEVATRKEVKSVYNKLITVEEKVKQVDKGLKFAGNSGEIKEHKLGDTITIKGEGTEANNFESAEGNINVKAEKDSLNLQLASKLKNMESFETKEDKEGNKTILNQDSLTFGNKKGKITGIVTGTEDDSAVNKKYVDEKFANNPFEYYTKEGNIKVVKDKNGKFHKATLDGEEVEANSVIIKAEPEAMVLGNIANGIEAKDSKEAVNGGQLYNKANKDASNIEVDKYIEKLSEKANIAKPKENLVTDKQVHDYLNGYYNKGEVDEKVKNIEGQAKEALGGVSNAVAMANLVQVNSYSDFRNNISAAYGYYGKQHALAIGLSGVTENRRVVYRASGSVNTSGNLALGVGLGVMLGDKESRMKYPEKSQKVKELEEINKKQDAEINNLKDKVSLFEKENKEIKEMLMKLLEQKK